MHVTTHVIGTSDCDALGHMNVARYFALCNENGFSMQRSLGWAPGQANKGRRYSFAVVRATSDFLSEVHQGETLEVATGISDIGTKSATFVNMIARPDGTPVFRSDWKSALLDLDSRKAVAIPDDLRSALLTFPVSEPAPGPG